MTVCPVCDLQVDDGEAIENGLATEYSGVFYYFCSPNCKERFESEPQRYVRLMNHRHGLRDIEVILHR